MPLGRIVAALSMNIKVAPSSQINSLDELQTAFGGVPESEEFPTVEKKPLAFGTELNDKWETLRFRPEEQNFIFIEGQFGDRPTNIDAETFDAYVTNLQVCFKPHDASIRFWWTKFDGTQGATYFKALVFLGDDRYDEVVDGLVDNVRNSLMDGSLRIEPLGVPLRKLSKGKTGAQGILVPSTGIESWKSFLADPERHFKAGFSAMEVAKSWESAKKRKSGLPERVESILTEAGLARQGIKLLLAQPERKTAIEGDGGDSCTDVFCIAKNGVGELLSIGVEAKVDESFDKYVDKWLVAGKSKNSPENRKERLNSLRKILGLVSKKVDHLRFQLFHRTVAPIFEARDFNCQHAVMLVQSFSSKQTGSDDFKDFVEALNGETPELGKLYQFKCNQPGITAWIGWVQEENSVAEK